MSKHIDLTGQKYGKLTVERLAGSKKNQRVWECLCECGRRTLVKTARLYSGHTKSCGCLKKDPHGAGRYVSQKGYVIVRSTEKRARGDHKWVPEHVMIMEQHLGRKLLSHENVHHKNGQRDDNRIDNLELWSTSQPSGQRVEDKIQWCLEFLRQYGHNNG